MIPEIITTINSSSRETRNLILDNAVGMKWVKNTLKIIYVLICNGNTHSCEDFILLP